MTDTTPHNELAAEQAHVDRAYIRLEELRAVAQRIGRRALADSPGGHSQMFLDREELIHSQERRLADLHLGDEQPLVFGRMDLGDGAVHHIGRIGVTDEDHDPLVVDWRAPVAEAFYRATGAEPMGLLRRRHITCRGQRVLALDDEIIDGKAAENGSLALVGEAALLAAVQKGRTGRMGDIVATIQAEQDVIVRAPLAGVLAVQGGPGTGKTAVALHRVAYLLYTHRLQLTDHGVLVVGPSPLFLRYVEQVLPSLGEEAVTMATLADVVPATTRGLVEPAPVTALKGDARMATLVDRAVEDRERALPRPIDVPHGRHVLRLTPALSRSIVERVRRQNGTHNQRRRSVERSVAGRLFKEWDQRRRGSLAAGQSDPLDHPDARREARDDFAALVRRTPEFREALERMWPVLTPHELLRDLFGSRALLRSAGRGLLDDDETALLERERGPSLADVVWSDADIPLIDHALSVLGDPPAQRTTSEDDDLGRWNRAQLAEDLAEASLFSDRELSLVGDVGWDEETTVELDPWDRTWAHVVVDEAQELSPMAWRMLSRRCPRGSMTVVGDLGQAASPHAPRRWEDLAPNLPRHRPPTVHELTVNYRTPADLMDVAAAVLAEAAPDLSPPVSVRRTGRGAEVVDVGVGGDLSAAAEATAARLASDSTGTLAVIVPRELIGELADRLDLPADPSDLLGRDRVLLTPEMAKGLEFDDVVVVEPALVAGHPHPDSAGLRTLYVALTRPTQRLAIVHRLPLPPGLARATDRQWDDAGAA